MAIRVIILLLAFARTFLAGDLSPRLPAEVASAYSLAWHDEFDGDVLNKA